ncbi:trypsin-like peptidase domain-containing protein, partial [Streptomyces sp. NPDC054802]
MREPSHVRRTVQVIGVRTGTGYAVAPDLVLTAGHVVGSVECPCRVRLPGVDSGSTSEGIVTWRADHIGHDAALVRLETALWSESDTATRFGALRGAQPVDCVTVGYPSARVSSAGQRKIEEHLWKVMPATGYEDGRYALNSALIAPTPLPVKVDHNGVERQPSPWAGQSGAAVLTGNEHVVVGVVISDPAAFPTGRIEAVRVTSLMDDPSFAELVNPKGRRVEGTPSEYIEYPTGVVDHREEIGGLIGIAANLRGEQLPFVAPEDTSPAHPDQILTQLEATAGESGILLLGPAGAGKTRTCLEVGDRALTAGWTVLHVKPGEPHVTTDQLISVLDNLSSPRVLFIIDYVNECHGLDFPAIRHRLLRKMASRGTRVAFLASARPGWYFHPESNPARTLFKALDISPDNEHEERIRRQIASSLAPRAISIIGKDRFFELCGRRPIIAMLIAMEAETLAKEGRLSSISGVRPGELLDWLARRLSEDDRLLALETQVEHADKNSSITMQACAAMTAAMPQDWVDVVACGTNICNQDDEQAEHLLGALLRMGWVISTPVGLSTVHDIVADQLLERTAVIPVSNAARRGPTSRILSGCLTRGRTVGRYASNIGRLLRDLEIDGRAESLSRLCGSWFSEHIAQLGEILGVHEDEGSYALGAVIDNPAWGQNVFEYWDELVGPWLSKHGRSLPARHLFYKGLRTVESLSVNHLVRESLAWLECHGASLEAGFVLGPLLGRQLEGESAAQAAECALSWLR